MKYCGGCNPQYDRVALAEYIEETYKSLIEFTDPYNRGVDFILAVQGCKVACSDLSNYKGIPIFIITGPEDVEGVFERVVDEIRKIQPRG